MLFLVCAVTLATGAWVCPSDPMPLENAVSFAYASNSTWPFKPGDKASPFVVWPANTPLPDGTKPTGKP